LRSRDSPGAKDKMRPLSYDPFLTQAHPQVESLRETCENQKPMRKITMEVKSSLRRQASGLAGEWLALHVAIEYLQGLPNMRFNSLIVVPGRRSFGRYASGKQVRTEIGLTPHEWLQRALSGKSEHVEMVSVLRSIDDRGAKEYSELGHERLREKIVTIYNTYSKLESAASSRFKHERRQRFYDHLDSLTDEGLARLLAALDRYFPRKPIETKSNHYSRLTSLIRGLTEISAVALRKMSSVSESHQLLLDALRLVEKFKPDAMIVQCRSHELAKIWFVEAKTGASRLNERQKAARDAVSDDKRFAFITVHIDSVFVPQHIGLEVWH